MPQSGMSIAVYALVVGAAMAQGIRHGLNHATFDGPTVDVKDSGYSTHDKLRDRLRLGPCRRIVVVFVH